MAKYLKTCKKPGTVVENLRFKNKIRPPGLPSATVRSYPKDSKICQYNSIIPANRKMSGEIMPERPWDLQYNHTRKTSLEHKKPGYLDHKKVCMPGLEHKKRAIAARADII